MKIENIKANKILDSRGEWTVEVEIESENKGKASIPSGKSLGSHEAVCLDCDLIEKNLPEFLKEVKNFDFKSSQEFDNFLIERAGKNKEKLGGNFTLGCSIAFAKVLAKKEGLELYEYLEKEYTQTTANYTQAAAESYNNSPREFALSLQESAPTPKLIINIIGGGVHSFNNLDFQECWLVSKQSFSEKLIAEILSVINILENKLSKPLGRNDEGAFCTNFNDNYEPFIYLNQFKENFELGADIAANQIKKDINWQEIYHQLKKLNVTYLEDPYKEDEFEYFANLRKEGFKVIGDDLTTTNTERLKTALEKNSLDGVIVKPNQIGTIKETFDFVKLAKENNLFTIFSHRSGETNDNWIIDLGISFNADYFKIGVPLQGERIAKWNRLKEIFDKNDK